VQSWLFKLENQTIGQRFEEAANTNALSPYQLLNVFIGKSIDKNLSWSLRVDNINDHYYEQVKDFSSPGRIYFTSIKWTP
jgi:outer membrane cobalamin receptor